MAPTPLDPASALSLFLTDAYFQRVLITAVLAAAVAAAIGVFLVLRNLALLGDGLGHVAFGGIALALALAVEPLPVALVWAIVGALIIQEMRLRGIVKGDTAIGILFTSSLAFGLIVLAQKGTYVDAESYLFGELFLVTVNDLNLVLVIVAIVLLVLLLLWRPLFAITFNAEAATVMGLPAHLLETLLTILSAGVIVVAARIVGILLVSSLVVVPAATALQFAKGFRTALLVSPLIAVGCVAVGIFLASVYDVFPGAAIALTSGIVFFCAFALSRLRHASA
ncbi:MAG: metal ABC transporter permease [Thermoplasmatota archaeon]